MNAEDALCARTAKSPTTVTDEFFRHACAHAGLAMITVDRSLRIRSWNAAAAHMFGAAAANVMGMNISGAIPMEARARGESLIRAAVWRAETNSMEFKHRDELGRPRSLIATFSPILDDVGGHLGALAVVRDITRRISLETELAHRHKMAALGEMAGALSHHFNNILGGIVTSVDFALTTDSPDLHKRTLQQGGVALGRAIKLIDSLLKFAEGDFRHADECDLTECILAVMEYMEPELRKARITLNLQLERLP
ncbi:MAG: PAS domain S-box protein, partial [Phycisphaerales bacterium]|nr:PAS domain S-box protein [Phycisphaerales bacterium]